MTEPGTRWRTRFAPSPTGALHIGSIRTALFNWLAARATGGTFIVRIEDTDQGRSVPGSEAQILDSLRWLGLAPDEGPDVGGPYQPYAQSERLAGYLQVGDELAARGHAYWCTCTPERLHDMRTAQEQRREPPRYDRRCLGRQDDVVRERSEGHRAVLRQHVPDGQAVWQDLILGEISFQYSDIDDGVLIKGDGFPTYHLANVVDDHAMEISHVIRAQEWVPSTPKHLALYAAMDWTPPAFAHVPVVNGDDGRKLSKRRGAVDILAYRQAGYLPEAIVNAMALLGWSSGTEQEVFAPDELVRAFSVERVHPAPAVYDVKRLDALNGLHIRRLAPDELAQRLRPWLPQLDDEPIARLVPLLHERMRTLADARDLVAPLIDEMPPVAEGVEWPPRRVEPDVARALLAETITAVEGGGLDDLEGLRARLSSVLEAHGVKPRIGFPVLYTAVLGSPQGVPVLDAMAFIGRDRTLARLAAALDRLA